MNPVAQSNAGKIALRRHMLKKRAALDAGHRRRASQTIAREVLHRIELHPDPLRLIVLYVSFGHEVETHELIAELLRRRFEIALPCVLHNPRRMEMRVIDRFPEGLVAGDFGILEPQPLLHPRVVEPGEIDLLLVPGVAFDRRGHRLGYGAGYYDRWLVHEHRAPAWGLSFDAQVVDAIPVDPWDRPVDLVITERGAIG